MLGLPLCRSPRDPDIPKDGTLKHLTTGEGKAAEIVLCCDDCYNFYMQHIPGCDVAALIKEREGDAALATELDAGLSQSAASASHAESPPTLTMRHDIIGGMSVVESCDLMSYSQVLERFGKTPKTLKMRSIKWLNSFSDLEVLYLKQGESAPYKKRYVSSTVHDTVQRHLMIHQPENFASQPRRPLKSMRGETFKQSLGGHTLLRPPPPPPQWRTWGSARHTWRLPPRSAPLRRRPRSHRRTPAGRTRRRRSATSPRRPARSATTSRTRTAPATKFAPKKMRRSKQPNAPMCKGHLRVVKSACLSSEDICPIIGRPSHRA